VTLLETLKQTRAALEEAEQMNLNVHDRPDCRGYSSPVFRAALSALDAAIAGLPGDYSNETHCSCCVHSLTPEALKKLADKVY